jgi:two-component system, NtrC family, sensor kinase
MTYSDTPKSILRERIRGLEVKNEQLDRLRRDLEKQLEARTTELGKTLSSLVSEVEHRKRAEEEAARAMASLLEGQKLQVLGQLSAAIAHEIRNPLNFILVNLVVVERQLDRMIVREGDTGLVRAAITDCKEGANRIQDLIQNLREFAVVDAQDLRPTDLKQVIESAVRLCWNEVKQHAKIRRDFDELPPIPCHPQRLSQVFVNLLLNASDAIEEKRRGSGVGEISIVVTRERGWAVVEVRDDGAGMPPDRLPQLFQPFFTTKSVGHGMGLGLHVAQKIVAAHGGTIGVASTVGQGTTFTVRLPTRPPG